MQRAKQKCSAALPCLTLDQGRGIVDESNSMEVETIRKVVAESSVAMVMAMDDTGGTWDIRLAKEEAAAEEGDVGTGVEKLARTGTSRRLVEPTTMRAEGKRETTTTTNKFRTAHDTRVAAQPLRFSLRGSIREPFATSLVSIVFSRYIPLRESAAIPSNRTSNVFFSLRPTSTSQLGSFANGIAEKRSRRDTSDRG